MSIQHAPLCPFGKLGGGECTCGAPTPGGRRSDPPPRCPVNEKQLEDIAEMMGGIVERRIRVTREGAEPHTIIVLQRCAVCAELVHGRVPDTGTMYELIEAIGTRVRLDYMVLHKCPPVAQSLFGATYEDLERLRAELERESTRLMDRVVSIMKIINEGVQRR